MIDYKKALQELHDACDEMNNQCGDEKELCLFCHSSETNCYGINHYLTCPLVQARKVLAGRD
jgi:hypothetical protein